jgi:hypothetical protein
MAEDHEEALPRNASLIDRSKTQAAARKLVADTITNSHSLLSIFSHCIEQGCGWHAPYESTDDTPILSTLYFLCLRNFLVPQVHKLICLGPQVYTKKNKLL